MTDTICRVFSFSSPHPTPPPILMSNTVLWTKGEAAIWKYLSVIPKGINNFQIRIKVSQEVAEPMRKNHGEGILHFSSF